MATVDARPGNWSGDLTPQIHLRLLAYGSQLILVRKNKK